MDVATSIGAMADDCAALVRHLRLSGVDLVGHSMGGMIAQECAIRHAALFDRVVLAASAPVNSACSNDLFATWVALFPADVSPRRRLRRPPPEGAPDLGRPCGGIERALWFRNLYHWVLSAGFFENKASVDALVQLAATYPYQQSAAALAGQVRAIAAFDSTRHLSAMRARTLVLAGTADLLFPMAASAAFAQTIPHANFVAIDGAAHSFPVELPQEFTRRALDFLDGPAPR